MRILTYCVADLNCYLNFLLKELCMKGIPYLLVENELHVDNYIIRFFELEEMKSIQVVSPLELEDYSQPYLVSCRGLVKEKMDMENNSKYPHNFSKGELYYKRNKDINKRIRRRYL